MFLLVCRQTRTYEKMVKFLDEHEHEKTGSEIKVLVSLSTNKNIRILLVDKLTSTRPHCFGSGSLTN